jgi:hypothetical protein
MCISAAPAKLSDTIVFAGECPDGDHLLGYQNNAENLSENDVNAMILPIPSTTKMSSKNMLDTTKCPKLLKDLAAAASKLLDRRVMTKSVTLSRGFGSIEVFKSGNYTIVLAENGLDIPNALMQLDEKERPEISEELCRSFVEFYPKWWMALCIWSGKSKMESHPILWKYTPMNKNYLFMPGLDSHTGGVPQVEKLIERDHSLVVGRIGTPTEDKYFATSAVINKTPNHIKSVMPNLFFAKENHDNHQTNCDWFVSTNPNDPEKFVETKPVGYIKNLFGGML